MDREDYEDLKIYIKEIKKIPLLSPEEEIKLAKKVEKNDLSSFNKFVKSNLRLVIKIAQHYVGRGIPLTDMVSEGNIGLMKAVKKYDYRKENRFSTYSSWWIKQSIFRAIGDKSRTIRVPFKGDEALRHADSAWNGLCDRNKTKPSVKEISEEIHFPYARLISLLNAQETSSLDSLVGTDEDSLMDFIADKRENPEKEIVYNSLREKIEDILSFILNKKELEIIQKVFGFNEYPRYSLREIGEEYGLSKQRISQIKTGALKKLRNDLDIKRLVSYLGK